jgi:hypothetical protein
MKPRRKETAGDRFRLAIDMFRVGVSLEEAQLRREFPGASDRFIVGEIRKMARRQAPARRRASSRSLAAIEEEVLVALETAIAQFEAAARILRGNRFKEE